MRRRRPLEPPPRPRPLTLAEECREAAIALRELEAIAVQLREERAQLTDEHADGMARVRGVLRLKLRELHEQGRK